MQHKTELELLFARALFADGNWVFQNQQGWMVCKTCKGQNRNVSHKMIGNVHNTNMRGITHTEDCVMHDVFRILNVYQEKK